VFCRHSHQNNTWQLDHGAVLWPDPPAVTEGQEHSARHWPTEWPHLPPHPVQEKRDHGRPRYVPITDCSSPILVDSYLNVSCCSIFICLETGEIISYKLVMPVVKFELIGFFYMSWPMPNRLNFELTSYNVHFCAFRQGIPSHRDTEPKRQLD